MTRRFRFLLLCCVLPVPVMLSAPRVCGREALTIESPTICVGLDPATGQVARILRFWDAHQRRLKAVNFIWLHDISNAQVQSYTKYYGIGQRGFAEYLGTLGLRYHDGRDKQAFQTLRQEAKSRGW